MSIQYQSYLELKKDVGEEFARKIEVTEQTYYRWRKDNGGMRIDEVKRLRRPREGEHPAQKISGRSFLR